MTRRRVVTEREVTRVSREGTHTLDVAGAVVTPSAREAAQRLGVTLGGDARDARKPRERAAREASSTQARSTQARSTQAHTPPDAQPALPTAPAKPASGGLTVAVGADHGGVALKDAVATRLRELGHAVVDVGTNSTDPVDYPDFAVAVARAVVDKRAELGIMVDGAGIGSCMAANKIAGVRAALCHDVTTAINAREHNGANVLTLGGGLVGTRLGLTIVETFLATPFGGGRHAARVAKIDALDRRG